MPSTDQILRGAPTTTDRFVFEVDGVEIGVFREAIGAGTVGGIDDPDERDPAGSPAGPPNRTTWPHLVLLRGVTKADAMFAWLSKASGEAFGGMNETRSTGSVRALDASGTVLRTWDFARVFPIRWRHPDLQIGDEPAEELKVAHHGATAMNQAPR